MSSALGTLVDSTGLAPELVRMAGGGAKGTVLEGVRPTIEALRAGRRRVHVIHLPEGPRAELSAGRRELEALARAAGVPLERARDGSGVRATVDPFPEEPVEALLCAPEPRRFVALDGVTDVGNLGSIARSAEVAGLRGLILEQRRSAALTPGAFRASAGALEHLRVGRAPSLPRALALAREEGLEIWLAEAGAPPLSRLPVEPGRSEWIALFGSEDRGVRDACARHATRRIGIPVRGRIDSLGVAAAAAYLLTRLAERAAEAEGGAERAPERAAEQK